MDQIIPERLQRAQNFDWFANCGQALDDSLPDKYRRVSKWRDAREHMLGRTWEMIAQQRTNALTEYLFDHHKAEYNSRWNLLASAATEYVEKQLGRSIFQGMRNFAPKGTNIGAAVWADVQRSLWGAFFEQAFADLNHPIDFFSKMLEVFEIGHYPCGWEMPWPEGKLIVY